MTDRRSHALGIGILVSLLALYLALRDADLPALGSAVFSAGPGWMALVLICYITHFWLKALRWCDLLKPVHPTRAAEAYPVMMTGFFANNILPAHLGEFVRMYAGSKVFGVAKTQVLSTIVLERILDFSVIAVIFGGALAAGRQVSGQFVFAGYLLLGATAAIWVAIFLALRFETAATRSLAWLLGPLPGQLRTRAVDMLSLALSAMHALKSARLVARIILSSLLQWLLVGLAVYAALQAVAVDITMAAAAVTLAATVLAVALPAAPGFFGTIQLGFVLALGPYGVAESDALAGSIVFHLISYLFVMASGVFALRRLSLKINDLRRHADAGQSGTG